MALINCPECNKQISDSATNCPNCGFPLSKIKEPIKQPISEIHKANNTQNESKKTSGCLKTALWIFIGAIGISFLIGIIGNIFGPNKEELEAFKIEAEAKIEAEEREQIKTDSIANAKKIENLPNDLRKTIEEINKVDFSKFRGSSANLQLELNLFNEWRKMIEETEGISKNSTEEAKQMAQKLKKTVQNIQAREFPILRKEYLKEAKKIMWEHDIDVSGSSNNTSINFTGGVFAANKNIKDFQEKTDYILKNFRFKRANYRWYKGADEYSYYEPFKGKDTDLFELQTN